MNKRHVTAEEGCVLYVGLCVIALPVVFAVLYKAIKMFGINP